MTTGDSATYLKNTEHAVRHLFLGVDQQESLLRGLTPPSRAQSEQEIGIYIEAADRYFARSFSEATLCGSILQVAFMGVYLYSDNEVISPDCASLLTDPNHPAVRFCKGRRVHDIPIGLLIYAGRNQFNHWDDESFNLPTQRVFDALVMAHYDNPLFDLAYEMNWPARTLHAYDIMLNELRWSTYWRYEADMKALLDVADPL